MKTWYYLEHGPLPAAVNMAVDQFLFDQAEKGQLTCPILRLYQWETPTLSVGYHQRLSRAVDQKALFEHGYQLVRRPTGGRAVLHINELTYAVVAPLDDPFSKKIAHNYRLLSEPLALFAKRFGKTPTITEKSSSTRPDDSRSKTAPCFASLSDSEIEADQKKLIGSSQKMGKSSFLQHGSIPLWNHSAQLQAITGSKLDMDRYMVSLSELTGEDLPAMADLITALTQAFSDSFKLEWQNFELDYGTPELSTWVETFSSPEFTARK